MPTRGSRVILAAGGPPVEAVTLRIQRWVRREPAKVLARKVGADHRTVNAWRKGHLPSMRHLMALAGYFGRGFLDDVFAPVLGHPAALGERLQRLEHDIAAIREDISEFDIEADGRLASEPGGASRTGRAALASAVRTIILAVAVAATVAAALTPDQTMARARAPRPAPARITRRVK